MQHFYAERHEKRGKTKRPRVILKCKSALFHFNMDKTTYKTPEAAMKKLTIKQHFFYQIKSCLITSVTNIRLIYITGYVAPTGMTSTFTRTVYVNS